MPKVKAHKSVFLTLGLLVAVFMVLGLGRWTAVSAEEPAAAVKVPAVKIDIVPLIANPANPDALMVTLPATGAKIAEGSAGLHVVPVEVPVMLAALATDKDGPASAYAWTLTGPTGSKAKLSAAATQKVNFTPDKVGYYKIDVVARNDVGAGPMASVQVRADTYVGVNAGGCVNCHPGEVNEWAETGHGVIFKEQIDGGEDPANSHYGEGCLRCHTTGYYIGANNGGFGDMQAKTGWKFPELASIQSGHGNWDAIPAALQNVGNIQCEVCHGPAQGHVTSGLSMDKSADERLCYSCHDGGGHHIKGTMFENAKHADATSQAWTYPTGPTRQACVPCHTSDGFASFLKNPTESASWSNSMSPMSCVTCHDPHSDANSRQLRITGKPVGIADVTKDFGQSAVCVECHNDRTTAADAQKGSYPHYSNAGELMSNAGGVTYGKTIPDSPHGAIVGAGKVANPDPAAAAATPFLFGGNTPGPCVVCHMWPIISDAKDPNYAKVGDHSFNMVSPDGKFEYTASCESCHGKIESFDLQAKADYDGNGTVEGVQEEVGGLLAILRKAIGDSGVQPIQGHPYFVQDQLNKANETQKNAIYNYLFVRGTEATMGKAAAIHDFKRSVALLQLSYKDLTGKDVPGAEILVK